MHADELTLLLPTVSGLQSMQEVCERFVTDSALKFNCKKSAVALFN